MKYLRDPKRPTQGPSEFPEAPDASAEYASHRVWHRYVHDATRLAQRETHTGAPRDSWHGAPELTRFIETYPDGPVVYADGDGTVDVQMTDRFGARWFMYRAREGWPGVIIGSTFRHSGVLRPAAMPSWHYTEYPLWYRRVLEADHILGRRGTQGWDGEEEDKGLLIRNLAEEGADRDENWRDWAWGMIKGIGKALAVLALSLLVFATGGLAMFALIGLAAVSLAGSIGHRIAQGQTLGQVIGGSLADLTGVSGVYAGITGKDIATQEDLGLTYEQRGEMFGQGLVQVAATAIGAYKGIRGGIRKFRKWRQARRIKNLGDQAAKIVRDGSVGPGDYLPSEFGEQIAADPVAYRSYRQIQDAGFDVELVYGAAPEGTAGVTVPTKALVRIYVRNNATARDAVGTLVHESSHVRRFMTRSRFLGQTGEYMAMRREWIFRFRRRPSPVERIRLWHKVRRDYPELPLR